MRGDPNLTLPAPAGGTATVPNPNRGGLYMDSTWFKDRLVTTNDVVRLSAAYEFNLGKWFGRHRIAGLAEGARQDRLRRWQNEILVDQNNQALSNAANPDAAANQPWRRRYVTEGDFNTYYAADPTQAIAPFAVGTSTVHSTFVARTRSNIHTIQDARSLMFASQSYWWKERLVTTLGYRVDRITFDTYGQGRIADPKDPRYKIGRASCRERV